MAKYVIDIDFIDQDCSFCPCFWLEDRRCGWCCLMKDEGKMWGELRTMKSNKVLCFDRPEWCPLIPADKDEALSLIHDVLKAAYGNEPMELIPNGFLARARDVGADVSDVGW